MKQLLGIAGALMVCGCNMVHNEALDHVRRQLLDGDSARFSEVNALGDLTCGLVNSKNLMGAYTGNQLFIVDGRTVYFGNDAINLSTANPKLCTFEADMQQINRVLSENKERTP